MPVPEHGSAVERHLLRDTAYARLCEAIVTGTLLPGEQLRDGELCSWLGLSRTPVRDALNRLEDEGLVECAPQRYTRVAPLRAGDVHHAFPVLAVLHGLATELAVPSLLPGDHVALDRHNDEFVVALRNGERERAFLADERFHAIFVARAGNPHIGQALERLTPALHRVENLTSLQLPGGRSVAQHQAILTRGAAGDAAGAAAAARANWMTLGTLAERALAD
jgi:DNA-binding GntR family transcriptional regulator